MTNCTLCPRNCRADRGLGNVGYCGKTDRVYIARAALHHWEEPCISGSEGSGTVFFSGCNLKCIYCQNSVIALGNRGKEISIDDLSETFLSLQSQNANNINLVTPTHYIVQIREALLLAKNRGLSIPVVYNTGGYELPESLDILAGLVDIYMPDFKYWTEKTASEYSNAPDYPQRAIEAIDKMKSLQSECIYDERGIMQKGVIVRHLLLPGKVYEAKQIIKYLFGKYGNSVVYSIMSQYTPMKHFDKYPDLNRRVRKKEYDSLVDFCLEIGIENAYIQDGESAKESFIPDFE